MRVVVVTAEFVDPIFSGNGVLSRTLCAGLHDLGHEVFVLCAREHTSAIPASLPYHGANHLEAIPVTTWRRLDRHGHWKEMAKGVTRDIVHRVKAFHPQTCLFVDWTTRPTAQKLGLKSWIFLCFRTFCASTELHTTPEDKDFYIKQEQESLTMAQSTVCLSRADEQVLQRLLSTPAPQHEVQQETHEPQPDRPQPRAVSGSVPAGDARLEQHPAKEESPRQTRPFASRDAIHILYPPLRQDFAGLPRPPTVSERHPGQADSPRARILCCVRLSPEKGALRFVDIVARLSSLLHHHHLVPTLCGAAVDAAYADRVRANLLAVAPHSEVIDGFLDADALQQLFRETLVNVHPSLNDAFGMTIVEAAACGTVSLVSNDNTVGAVDLFRHAAVRKHSSIRHLKQQQGQGQTTEQKGKKNGEKGQGEGMRGEDGPVMVEAQQRCVLRDDKCDANDVAPATDGDDDIPLLLCDVTDPDACAQRISQFLNGTFQRTRFEMQMHCHAVANSWTRSQYAQALARLSHLDS